MANCKKPINLQFLVQLAKDNKAKMIALEKTARPFSLHLRCLQDTTNIFAWFMCSEVANEFKE